MNYLQVERKNIPALVDELNVLLANYQLYYQKLRNFHWNIRGENFFELHELFEQLYTDAHGKIDEIAERIQTLKYRPLSLLKKYLETAEIEEFDGFADDTEMMKMVLSDQATLLQSINRATDKAIAAQDEGTLHLLRTYQLVIEKHSWMIDMWLAKPVSTTNTESVSIV